MDDRRDPDDNAEIRIPRGNTGEWSAPRVTHQTPVVKSGTRGKVLDQSPGGYGTPNIRDWYFFAVELQTALSAGVTFVDALRLVGTTSGRSSIRKSAQFLLHHLQQGHSAALAVGEASNIPPLIRNLLIAGLRGGDVPAVLRHIVDHYSWLLELRGRILRAIAYPSFLLVAGALVMIFRDVAIATLTGQASTSEAVVATSLKYLLPIITAAAAAVIVAWMIYTPPVKPHFDRIILTAPVIGKMVRSYALAVFYRVLSILLNTGMPVTNAWILAQQSVPNHHISSEMQTGLRYLQDGEPLHEALRHTQKADKQAQAMVAVGESVGTAAALLRRYAEWREDELKNRSRMLTSLIGLPCIALIALGYFVSTSFLAALAFLIVLARRLV